MTRKIHEISGTRQKHNALFGNPFEFRKGVIYDCGIYLTTVISDINWRSLRRICIHFITTLTSILIILQQVLSSGYDDISYQIFNEWCANKTFQHGMSFGLNRPSKSSYNPNRNQRKSTYQRGKHPHRIECDNL